MISFISLWFSGLSKTSKIFTVVILLAVLAISIQSARLARSEYLRLKAVEVNYEKYKKEVEDSEIKEEKIIKKNKVFTDSKKVDNSNINKKLKEDEKIIDSDTINDDDINRFISKHNKG